MRRKISDFRKLDEIKMKEGEEALAGVINPVQGDWTLDPCFIGLDGGNTQCRVIGLDKYNLETDVDDYFIIPSEYGMSETSDEEIRPQGNRLYNKMDSTVISQAPVGSKVLFNKVRIVRGTKKMDSSFSEGLINHNVPKRDSKTYHLNVIDSIGYWVMCKHQDSIPKEVKVRLGLSLRPGEVSQKAFLDLFRERILNKFTWKNAEYGIEMTINIVDVVVKSEPESQQIAQYRIPNEDGSYDEIPDYTLAIMGGGSNSAVEVLHKDISIKYASRMFKECGESFIQDLTAEITRKKHFTPVKEEVEKSLKSGLVKYGNDTIDISSSIVATVLKYGEQMSNNILQQVLNERTRLELTQINVITFSGRFLRKCNLKWSEELNTAFPGRFDTVEKAEAGISIADVIKEWLEPLSPKTEFEVIDSNLIPLGNLLAITELYEDEVDSLYPEYDEEIVVKEVHETIEVANSSEPVDNGTVDTEEIHLKEDNGIFDEVDI